MEVDVLNSIPTTKVHFCINPLLWEGFDRRFDSITNCQWQETKFLDNGRLHAGMSTIPTDKGGIYVFIAKPDIIPGTHLYIMYIGRALNTPTQNLRKRCRHYIADTRPMIQRMITTWGDYLYIRYVSLEDNAIIKSLEKELINKLLPPFNDQIPDIELRAAVQAFSV